MHILATVLEQVERITGLRLMWRLLVSWVHATLSSIRQILLFCVFTALVRHCHTQQRYQSNRFLLSCAADCSSDLVTISLQAGWAVTPASGPTGQSECYRAGSRWPSWCHTDSQIGFNCQGWSLAQWVCGGRGTLWVAGLKIGPDDVCRDLIHLNDHAQRISLSLTWTLRHTQA